MWKCIWLHSFDPPNAGFCVNLSNIQHGFPVTEAGNVGMARFFIQRWIYIREYGWQPCAHAAYTQINAIWIGGNYIHLAVPKGTIASSMHVVWECVSICVRMKYSIYFRFLIYGGRLAVICDATRCRSCCIVNYIYFGNGKNLYCELIFSCSIEFWCDCSIQLTGYDENGLCTLHFVFLYSLYGYTMCVFVVSCLFFLVSNAHIRVYQTNGTK